MVTDKVELVAVQAGLCRSVESLSQFAIEDQITEALAFEKIFKVLGQADAKKVGCGKRVSAVMDQDSGFCHEDSLDRTILQKCFYFVNWRFLCLFGKRQETWRASCEPTAKLLAGEARFSLKNNLPQATNMLE